MENQIIKPLTKYILLMIFHSLIFLPWNILLDVSDIKDLQLFFDFQNYGSIAVKVATAILIYFDLKRLNSSLTLLGIIASLFYPFLGIAIFALLFLEKHNKASA